MTDALLAIAEGGVTGTSGEIVSESQQSKLRRIKGLIAASRTVAGEGGAAGRRGRRAAMPFEKKWPDPEVGSARNMVADTADRSLNIRSG